MKLHLILCLLSAFPLALAAALPHPVAVFSSRTDGYHTYRIPAIIRAANGDLLAFCEGRKNSSSDTGDIDLLVKRSSDSGLSWSAAQVIWDDAENTCGNPTPVLDETTGILWLLMTHNLGVDHQPDISGKTSRAKGTRTVWITHSKDHGQTWASPVEITSSTKDPSWGWYSTGPGVGIQIEHGPHKGRLVIPCFHSYDLPEGVVGNDAMARPRDGGSITFGYRSHVIFSDDHGQTWQLSGVIRPVVNECQLVELAVPAGTLMMDMRRNFRALPSAEQNLRGVSTSFDGGVTWSDVQPHPGLSGDPVCQASILRHAWPKKDKAGLLLFSNPLSNTAREKMTVRFSWDDGKTWGQSLQLNSGFAAYSCLVSLSETDAACLYESGGDIKDTKTRYREIIFQRFSVPPRQSEGK